MPPRRLAGRQSAALLAACSIASLGCAQIERWWHPPPPPPAPVAPPEDRGPPRILPYPVQETQAFARAVARGTRTRTGSPGAAYWHQYARYAISVELNATSGQVSGRGTVWYFNHSPDTLREIWVHLDQNLFAANAVRDQVVPVTGGMEIARVAVR